MTHKLTLTLAEQRTLGWVADRYVCAEILYDGMYAFDDEAKDGTVIYEVPDDVVMAYLEALPEENGNPEQYVPPCVGGTLAEKLLRLYDEYV